VPRQRQEAPALFIGERQQPPLAHVCPSFTGLRGCLAGIAVADIFIVALVCLLYHPTFRLFFNKVLNKNRSMERQPRGNIDGWLAALYALFEKIGALTPTNTCTPASEMHGGTITLGQYQTTYYTTYHACQLLRIA
jgi:hypothetical protein